jgi:hypothetical protein
LRERGARLIERSHVARRATARPAATSVVLSLEGAAPVSRYGQIPVALLYAGGDVSVRVLLCMT